MRKIITALVFAMFMVAVACNPVKAQQPPNVVVFLLDDASFCDFSAYKNIYCQNEDEVNYTPAIKRLAEEGTTYASWYSPVPLCGPSRFSLLTGAHPTDYNIYDNWDASISTFTGDTLPARLQQAGYRTGHSGKWHLGANNLDPYIDPVDYPVNNGFDWSYGWGLWPGYTDMPDKEYSTLEFSFAAIEFIKTTPITQPLFLYVAYNAPHTLQYPFFEGVTGQGFFADSMYEVDVSIARIRDQIDRRGQLDNTIIIVMSDNGWAQPKYIDGATGKTVPPDGGGTYWGDPLWDNWLPERYDRGVGFGATFRQPVYTPSPSYIYPQRIKLSEKTGKKTLWEGGIKSPAIIKWPTGTLQLPGGIDYGIHYMPDIYATIELLVFGENNTEAGLDMLTDQHATLHTTWLNDRAVLHEGWKWHSKDGALYYLPDEVTDYSSDPAHAGKLTALSGLPHGQTLPPQGWGAP